MTTAIKVSAFQREVLEKLALKGAYLMNSWEGEGAPYQPPGGMFSGSLHYGYRGYRNVPYRTIAALLRMELLQEQKRNVSEGHYGYTPFQRADIYYCLTEKARELLHEKTR